MTIFNFISLFGGLALFLYGMQLMGDGLKKGSSDALKAAPADEINVCLNTGSSPCILVPADGSDNFVYMVLPVRLRAGQ